MKPDIISLPDGASHQDPKSIVVHAMGEFIEGKPAVEFLRYSGLSAHALVCPDGKVIRCRRDHQGAYHAKGFNTDSLGIEFLVAGDHNWTTFKKAIMAPYLTNAQYNSGVKVAQGWVTKFDIKSINRHSDLSPDRKKDPGSGFPWEQFLKDVEV